VRYVAQTLTAAQQAQARANIGAVAASGLTLGIHTDGLIYLFVDGVPVGAGIELPEGGDVVGYVDSANNIVVKGNLPDGTYSVKYEMENGTVVNIGNMVLDSNVYYSVTNTLTNCTSNNSAKQAIEGNSYSATITAKSGYELSSVKVTMGGTDISASAVSGGKITISNVTGNIVITAVAEVIKTETNFAVYDASNTTDWSKWINNARAGSDGTYRSDTVSVDYGTPVVSNYIAVQNGDVVEFAGFYVPSKSSVVYNSSKSVLQTATISSLTSYLSDINLNNAQYAGSFKVNSASVGYIRIGGYIYTKSFPISIKIKRNGQYI
jgi:hypothetical protein